jgi:hypothetical protein
LYARKAKNLEVKKEEMVEQSKYDRVSKKPPEPHYAKRWFGFIIKTFLLYRNADERYPHQCQQNGGRGMQAGRIIKSIDG